MEGSGNCLMPAVAPRRGARPRRAVKPADVSPCRSTQIQPQARHKPVPSTLGTSLASQRLKHEPIAPGPHSLVPQRIGDSANCHAVPNSTAYSLQPVQWKAAALVTQKFNHDDDEDEDEDFPMSDIDNSGTDTSAEDSSEDLQITNKELAGLLPSRTVAKKSAKDQEHPARRAAAIAAREAFLAPNPARCRTTKRKAMDVVDSQGPSNSAKRHQPNAEAVAHLPFHPAAIETAVNIDNDACSAQLSPKFIESAYNVPLPSGGKRKNPIFHFFEVVDVNARNEKGEPGDLHYRCFHGKRKVVTIGTKSKGSVQSLLVTLKSQDLTMYRLYEKLKHDAKQNKLPSNEEVRLAANLPSIDLHKSNAIVANLKALPDEPVSVAAVYEWDQNEFEQRLVEWLVTADQPFSEVDNPAFHNLLQFTHNGGKKLSIPNRNTVRRRVIKMGQESANATKKFFQELESKVSISADAWTSSNQHAFLAIVVHYITNDWELEEMLLDFRELTGEHSGDNLCSVVWDTLETYGIEDRVQGVQLDNASNNDTLVDGLEEKCAERGIPFLAKEARLRCFPHTTHLAVLKLLEAIGAISTSERATAEKTNFQENVTLPTDRRCDDNVVVQEDLPEDDNTFDASVDNNDSILTAIWKLRKIVRSVRSSPQRRQAWLAEVNLSFRSGEEASDVDEANGTFKSGKPEVPLMLILDVKTRWSSTHQMLRRALSFRTEIDRFVGQPQNKDALRRYELTDQDWNAIELITRWLRLFRDATVDMSTTKQSTLSYVHCIFRTLQDHIKTELARLPDGSPLCIRNGLVAAHRKLSDYYLKFDDSPYYIWASILDPRIGYEALRADYHDEPDLQIHVDKSLEKLRQHYDRFYAPHTTTLAPSHHHDHPHPLRKHLHITAQQSPVKRDWTARYRTTQLSLSELDDYLRLCQEPFGGCDPIKWWAARRQQFPNLSRLVRDIFSIPGSSVAVERIFSGGRDTISLRRASLLPETIRVLMVLKNRLLMAHRGVETQLAFGAR